MHISNLKFKNVNLVAINHQAGMEVSGAGRRTNYLEYGNLLQVFASTAGVESGFGHFANALGANSLIMIGYYQHYKNYKVYSGRFKQDKDVTLYYHPGPLHQMKLTDLWPSVMKRLNLTQTAALMRSLLLTTVESIVVP